MATCKSKYSCRKRDPQREKISHNGKFCELDHHEMCNGYMSKQMHHCPVCQTEYPNYSLSQSEKQDKREIFGKTSNDATEEALESPASRSTKCHKQRTRRSNSSVRQQVPGNNPEMTDILNKMMSCTIDGEDTRYGKITKPNVQWNYESVERTSSDVANSPDTDESILYTEDQIMQRVQKLFRDQQCLHQIEHEIREAERSKHDRRERSFGKETRVDFVSDKKPRLSNVKYSSKIHALNESVKRILKSGESNETRDEKRWMDGRGDRRIQIDGKPKESEDEMNCRARYAGGDLHSSKESVKAFVDRVFDREFNSTVENCWQPQTTRSMESCSDRDERKRKLKDMRWKHLQQIHEEFQRLLDVEKSLDDYSPHRPEEIATNNETTDKLESGQ